jgi:hypothetical protein
MVGHRLQAGSYNLEPIRLNSMRNTMFIALGLGFILMGAGLFALTLRKAKPTPAVPNKSQLREQAALAEETKKMRIGAGGIAGFGLVLLLIGIF